MTAPPENHWTDQDRDDLARTIEIAAVKLLDLRLSKHRLSVLAVALLARGYHRSMRPSTSDTPRPPCECGSDRFRSDVTLCLDCGRWQ